MECRFLTLFIQVLLCWQAEDVEGFCGQRQLQSTLSRSAVRAAEWLRNQQDVNGTYGEGHVSAFAFHSLRLIGHSVEGGADHLNDELTTSGLDSISGGRLAHYVHGALATCRDPQKFYDFDLIQALEIKLEKYPEPGFDHPFQYGLAVLALCSNRGRIDVKKLTKHVRKIKSKIESQLGGYGDTDTLSVEVLALSCILKAKNSEGKLLTDAQEAVDAASLELHQRQQKDATFHENEVSAALAAQALIASREDDWNWSETMKWLEFRQNPDGSFINGLATIYVLPSLVGALPYEVRDVTCYKNLTDEKKMIEVCVELKFDANNHTVGKTPPPPVCVTVLNGTNAHDILKLAANQHPCYHFTAVLGSYGHSVLSICDIHRVPVEKFYWMIYIDGHSAPVGIDDLKPQNGDILSFKFEKLHWRK